LHVEHISVPTIMASGNLLPGDLLGLDIPPVTGLMKPYSMVELLALVKAILQSTRSGSDVGST
jgi:DNA-binding response OmpR family regulator